MVIYRLLWCLLTPIIPLYLKRRRARGKEDSLRLGERYGKTSAPRPDGFLVWIHAASVGEMQSVLPLISRLTAARNDLHVLLTTGTVTSAQLIEARQMPKVLHQYVPLDHPAFVRRFLRHFTPDLALWVESEFWPELLLQTHARAIPMMLVNARMSEISARRWQRFPKTIARFLGCFQAITASSDVDAKYLAQLGATHIEATCNLKYDAAALEFDAQALETFQQHMAGRTALLAASTHEGEEAMIAALVRRLLPSIPNLITVIIPRHAHRGESVASLLRAQGFAVSLRSAGQHIMPETEIYVADSMGELGLFFEAIKTVIMGGSLVPRGGHNLLEPARAACAIITGKHMHNFSEMTANMIAENAVIQVSDSNALYEQCLRILTDKSARQLLCQKAKDFSEKSQGACDTLMQLIKPIITQGTAHA